MEPQAFTAILTYIMYGILTKLTSGMSKGNSFSKKKVYIVEMINISSLKRGYIRKSTRTNNGVRERGSSGWDTRIKNSWYQKIR